jgi:hypothetical protein
MKNSKLLFMNQIIQCKKNAPGSGSVLKYSDSITALLKIKVQ